MKWKSVTGGERGRPLAGRTRAGERKTLVVLVHKRPGLKSGGRGNSTTIMWRLKGLQTRGGAKVVESAYAMGALVAASLALRLAQKGHWRHVVQRKQASDSLRYSTTTTPSAGKNSLVVRGWGTPHKKNVESRAFFLPRDGTPLKNTYRFRRQTILQGGWDAENSRSRESF